MGFRFGVCYYWALCVIAFSTTINSFELRRVQLRKPCCNNVNIRPLILDPRQRVLSLTELLQIANENLKTSSLQQAENDPLSAATKFGLNSPPIAINDDSQKKIESQKAQICSKMPCLQQYMAGPVCACNFNTGNVVTFKNKCDLKKHNCRFDTDFKSILEEICPWEFESRRSERSYDYSESKYYN